MRLSPHFVLSEFSCKCGCKMPDFVFENLKNKLIPALENARSISKVPFYITSGYRCDEYNKSVGGVKNSAHTKGLACDIAISSSGFRYEVLSSLIKAGFSRIGVYRSFIHCDVDYSKPYPVIWYGGC